MRIVGTYATGKIPYRCGLGGAPRVAWHSFEDLQSTSRAGDRGTRTKYSFRPLLERVFTKVVVILESPIAHFVASNVVTLEFLLAMLVTLVAGVSRGMLGFGATLIIVPSLASLYGAVEAVVVASLIEVPAVLYLLPSTIRTANWRQIAPVGFASLTTIPIGAFVLVSVDPEVARKLIASAVIIFAVLLASGWRYEGVASLPLKLAVGAGSGIMGGMANIGGPLVVLFLVASKQAAAGVRSGIMAFFSFSTAYRVAVYAFLGLYVLPIVGIAAALIAPYLLGIALGKQLFSRVSETWFMRLAIGLVLCTGVVALLK